MNRYRAFQLESNRQRIRALPFDDRLVTILANSIILRGYAVDGRNEIFKLALGTAEFIAQKRSPSKDSSSSRNALCFGEDVLIKDEGIAALCQMIEKTHHDHSIDALKFEGLGFGNDGAIAIASLLKDDFKIKKIQLASNIIGQRGAKALAEALKTNANITRVDLRGNKVSIS